MAELPEEEEVALFLDEAVGTNKYHNIFVNESLTWDVLPMCTSDVFLEMGVKAFGHRKRLLAALGASDSHIPLGEKSPPSEQNKSEKTLSKKPQLSNHVVDIIRNEVDDVKLRGKYLSLAKDNLKVIEMLGTNSAEMMGFLETELDQLSLKVHHTSSFREVDKKEELEKWKEIVTQHSQSQENFIHNISHELVNPLHGIIGMTDKLQSSQSLDLKTVEAIRNVRACVFSCLSVTFEMLNFGKLQAGTVQPENMPFDLHTVLMKIIDENAATTSLKGIEIALFLIGPWDRGLQFIGDHRQIYHVIGNFMSNACKFTQSGQIVIFAQTVMAPKDMAPLSDKHQWLRISVADTGIGMSTKTVMDVFDRYQQGEGIGVSGGTGLGLSICKSTVNLLGGVVSVRTHLGRGSTFSMTIPLETMADKSPIYRNPQQRPVYLMMHHAMPFYNPARTDFLLCTPSKPLESIIQRYLKMWGNVGHICRNISQLLTVVFVHIVRNGGPWLGTFSIDDVLEDTIPKDIFSDWDLKGPTTLSLTSSKLESDCDVEKAIFDSSLHIDANRQYGDIVLDRSDKSHTSKSTRSHNSKSTRSSTSFSDRSRRAHFLENHSDSSDSLPKIPQKAGSRLRESSTWDDHKVDKTAEIKSFLDSSARVTSPTYEKVATKTRSRSSVSTDERESIPKMRTRHPMTSSTKSSNKNESESETPDPDFSFTKLKMETRRKRNLKSVSEREGSLSTAHSHSTHRSASTRASNTTVSQAARTKREAHRKLMKSQEETIADLKNELGKWKKNQTLKHDRDAHLSKMLEQERKRDREREYERQREKERQRVKHEEFMEERRITRQNDKERAKAYAIAQQKYIQLSEERKALNAELKELLKILKKQNKEEDKQGQERVAMWQLLNEQIGLSNRFRKKTERAVEKMEERLVSIFQPRNKLNDEQIDLVKTFWEEKQKTLQLQAEMGEIHSQIERLLAERIEEREKRSEEFQVVLLGRNEELQLREGLYRVLSSYIERCEEFDVVAEKMKVLMDSLEKIQTSVHEKEAYADALRDKVVKEERKRDLERQIARDIEMEEDQRRENSSGKFLQERLDFEILKAKLLKTMHVSSSSTENEPDFSGNNSSLPQDASNISSDSSNVSEGDHKDEIDPVGKDITTCDMMVQTTDLPNEALKDSEMGKYFTSRVASKFKAEMECADDAAQFVDALVSKKMADVLFLVPKAHALGPVMKRQKLWDGRKSFVISNEGHTRPLSEYNDANSEHEFSEYEFPDRGPSVMYTEDFNDFDEHSDMYDQLRQSDSYYEDQPKENPQRRTLIVFIDSILDSIPASHLYQGQQWFPSASSSTAFSDTSAPLYSSDMSEEPSFVPMSTTRVHIQAIVIEFLKKLEEISKATEEATKGPVVKFVLLARPQYCNPVVTLGNWKHYGPKVNLHCRFPLQQRDITEVITESCHPGFLTRAVMSRDITELGTMGTYSEDAFVSNKSVESGSESSKSGHSVAETRQQLQDMHLHVLIVEDNIVNQMVAIRMLSKIGCRCTVACNGQEAIEMLFTEADTFDLILMDYQMPVMDGLTATAIIRENEDTGTRQALCEGRSPPLRHCIIFLSGDRDKETRLTAMEHGADEYITKPIGMEDLWEAILPALKRQSDDHENITNVSVPAQDEI